MVEQNYANKPGNTINIFVILQISSIKFNTFFSTQFFFSFAIVEQSDGIRILDMYTS